MLELALHMRLQITEMGREGRELLSRQLLAPEAQHLVIDKCLFDFSDIVCCRVVAQIKAVDLRAEILAERCNSDTHCILFKD